MTEPKPTRRALNHEMTRFGLLALATLATLLPATANADCMLMGLSTKLITVDHHAVARDGGILVAAVPQARGALAKGDPAVQTGWRFAKLRGRPTIVSLAPGLAVVRVPKAAQLVDAKGTPLISVTLAGRLPALKAPAVKRIEYVGNTMGYHGSARVVVSLAGTAPAGTAAMVLLDAKTQKPKSWGLVTAGAATVDALSWYDCLALPNGTVMSKAGESVRVSYVDELGRMSPPSRAFQIIEKAKAKPRQP